MTEYRDVRVKMTCNCYNPFVYIARSCPNSKRIVREYQVSNASMERMNKLFDKHNGHIFVDFETSSVELTSAKG